MSLLDSTQNFYLEFQLVILGATFLFLISAVFVLNRAVDEIGRARTAREQAESAFNRLNGLLSGIESGDTPFADPNRVSRRVSMSGPIVKKTMASGPAAPLRQSQRVKPKL